VHLPEEKTFHEPDKLFVRFISDYIKELSRPKKRIGKKTILGLSPMYVWAREQKKSDNPHWHVWLILNGDYIQNINYPLETAERCWARKLEQQGRGYIHWCTKGRDGQPQKNGIKLIRDKGSELRCNMSEAFEQFAYMAKPHTKDQTPMNVNAYGCSMIPNIETTFKSQSQFWLNR